VNMRKFVTACLTRTGTWRIAKMRLAWVFGYWND
jgi:hypothetical protein